MIPTLSLGWGTVATVAAGGASATVLAAWVLAQSLTVLFSLHRYQTLWRWWAGARRAPPAGRRDAASTAPRAWPRVTVQLPVYNERRVVERLIAAAAALRYPADRLEIQVLDDSTDETWRLARRAAARARTRGVDVRVLHRRRRRGFKAGALAAGLRRARGEIVVVFDADFLPAPDFLERAVPHFDAPDVGMVQARWTHLNAEGSWRHAGQAALLDAHFLIEHGVRMRAGLFFNFNGTAGAWRRACIETSGGWQADTLTEDLDLSYRAQLRGWRFVFDPEIRVPAELPASWAALRSQQRRWVRGSVQTLRKLIGRVLASERPLAVKLEACFHLGANLAYPAVLGMAILGGPVLLLFRPPLRPFLVDLGWVLFGLGPAALALWCARRAAGAPRGRACGDVAAGLLLAAGLTLHNALAAFEGFRAARGPWVRTPKTGEGGPPVRAAAYRSARVPRGIGELAGAAALLAAAFLVASRATPAAAAFPAWLAAGLAVAGWEARAERRGHRPPA